jgi:hypothetical protein
VSFETPPGTADDFNPYAPPEASLAAAPVDLVPAGDLAAAEAIRRAHIRHEAAVRSIAMLHYLAAFFGIIGAVSVLFLMLTALPQRVPLPRAILIAIGVVYALLGGLHLALGIGLNRLQNWARYTDAILIGVVLFFYGLAGTVSLIIQGDPAGLFGIAVAVAILGYILYLLLSSKATMIFSAEYKGIIEQTPHIRNQTGLAVKLCLAVLVAVIAVAMIGGILAAIMS